MELHLLLLKSKLRLWRVPALTALLFIAATQASCDRDACENPFLGGFSLSGEAPIEPVSAGKRLGLHVNLATTSAASLEDAEVAITLPPEVEVVGGVGTQPNERPVEAVPGRLVWRPGKVPSRSDRGLFISIVSKSDWKLWKAPIQVDMSVNFHNTWGGKCRNWPDGRYRMTGSWSVEGHKEGEWHRVADR